MDCTITFLDCISELKKEEVISRIYQLFCNADVPFEVKSLTFNELKIKAWEELDVDAFMEKLDNYFLKKNLLVEIEIDKSCP